MAYPKIILGESVLIDLTSDTVAPENLKQGETAHDKRGESIVGTYVPESPEIPTPTITVADSGLITAECGDKSATHQLSSADDSDFIASNIKNGITVFGQTGTYAPESPEIPTPTITVADSGLITTECGDKSATHQLSSADDSDFIASNIKNGITIFGQTGTYDGGGVVHAPTISVADSGLITAECGGESATHQLSSADDADFIAANIKNGVTIFGIAGTYDGSGSGNNIQTDTMTLDSATALPVISVTGTCSHVLVYPTDGQTINTNNVFFLYADAANAGADAYSVGGSSVTGNTYGESTLLAARRTVFNNGSIRLGTPAATQWAPGNYTWLAW